MSTRFVSIDRNTPLLLPPDLRDWVPADALAHFVIDAVEALDLREMRVNNFKRLHRLGAGQKLALAA